MNPLRTLILAFKQGGLRHAVSRFLFALALALGPLAPMQSQGATPSPQAKLARDLAAGLAETGKSKAS